MITLLIVLSAGILLAVLLAAVAAWVHQHRQKRKPDVSITIVARDDASRVLDAAIRELDASIEAMTEAMRGRP